MRWFVRRLTVVIAVAFVAMTVAVIVTPGISSADCERNMSWNWATWECKPPPASPDWYAPPPNYAPSFASQDVPPPPPQPWWTKEQPMWRVGLNQWGVYVGYVWIPL